MGPMPAGCGDWAGVLHCASIHLLYPDAISVSGSQHGAFVFYVGCIGLLLGGVRLLGVFFIRLSKADMYYVFSSARGQAVVLVFSVFGAFDAG